MSGSGMSLGPGLPGCPGHAPGKYPHNHRQNPLSEPFCASRSRSGKYLIPRAGERRTNSWCDAVCKALRQRRAGEL
jgi:hypothetical protein